MYLAGVIIIIICETNLNFINKIKKKNSQFNRQILLLLRCVKFNSVIFSWPQFIIPVIYSNKTEWKIILILGFMQVNLLLYSLLFLTINNNLMSTLDVQNYLYLMSNTAMIHHKIGLILLNIFSLIFNLFKRMVLTHEYYFSCAFFYRPW